MCVRFIIIPRLYKSSLESFLYKYARSIFLKRKKNRLINVFRFASHESIVKNKCDSKMCLVSVLTKKHPFLSDITTRADDVVISTVDWNRSGFFFPSLDGWQIIEFFLVNKFDAVVSYCENKNLTRKALGEERHYAERHVAVRSKFFSTTDIHQSCKEYYMTMW